MEWSRRRAHVDKAGREKIRYTPAEADDVVVRMNARPGRAPVSAYPCPECGWIHIGSLRTQRPKPDPVVVAESGERVDAHIRMENSGSQRQRYDHILKLCRSAERRALTSPSPPIR